MRRASGPRATTSEAGVLGGPARRTFRLDRFPPADDLADLVERHWVVAWDVPPGEQVVQTVLPHPCVNLVAEPGSFAAHGIPLGRFDRVLVGRGAVLGTKFRPGAFCALTGDAPMVDGPAVPATAFLGPHARTLGESAALAAREGRAREGRAQAGVALVEAALRSHRAARPAPGWLAQVHAVVAVVVDGSMGPEARVADLARAAGLSTRALQRLLRDRVGVGPSWLLRRHRVQLAAELVAGHPGRRLADVALEAGFDDQAHMTGDFTALVGMTPGAYARRCALVQAWREPALA